MAKRFRKRAMEIYGYKRGAVKKALEEAMKRFIGQSMVDWSALRGCIKSDLTSVELQHRVWRRTD